VNRWVDLALIVSCAAVQPPAEASTGAQRDTERTTLATRPFDEAAVLRAPDGASGDQFG
jgi:hypothetical protein